VSRFLPPILLWAARDALRRPGEALLIALAMAALVFVAATPLLILQGLATTGDRILEDAPSLVLRRTGPAGFVPVPIPEAVAAARSVRGITEARPRTWGLVAGSEAPWTIVGVDAATATRLSVLGIAVPGPGEAVVGTGAAIPPGGTLSLAPAGGGTNQAFRVVGSLPEGNDLVAHDRVLLAIDDAVRLLGLPPGTATDLALDVFHDGEAAAIRPALESAMPWPVRIADRTDERKSLATALSRLEGLSSLVLAPALLGLVLLVLAGARDGAGRRKEAGLLKTMGWTTGDVVRLRLLRALVLAAPGIVAGLGAAFAVAIRPGLPSLVAPWMGWTGVGPGLVLDGAGAVTVLIGVAGAVLAPWLVATLWPILRDSTQDPAALLEDAS
jgi:hypothetical protein